MVCYKLISYPIFEYLGSKNEAAFEINLFVGLLYSVLNEYEIEKSCYFLMKYRT